MKILHINSYFSTGSFYSSLYDEQLRKGIAIAVYVPVAKRIKKNVPPESYTCVAETHQKWERYLFHVKHEKIVKDVCRRYSSQNFDLIHAHSLFSNGYVACQLHQEMNIPYVVAVRNTDVNVFFRQMLHLRHLGVRILIGAEKVIFLSQSYLDQIVQRYVPQELREVIKAKSLVIPNGIDAFWLDNVSARTFDKSTKQIRLVFAGQIDRNKNNGMTIQACNYLIKQGYNVHYTIIGKVTDTAYLRKLGTENFVTYISPKSKEELAMLYKDQDIFVMPSIYETFGLAYAEAMSQGLPVIYTRGQGFDKQFPDGKVGYPVDSRNPREIADAVIKITDEYDVISRRCATLCRKFDWGSIADNYLSMYQEMVMESVQ